MDLRTPIPTLEPDDAFVAQLSARAAAGAPVEITARPVSTWRVGFAAAAVALVLVGVAWLAGLRPGGTDTAPPPGPVDSPTPSPTFVPDTTALDPASGVRPEGTPVRTGGGSDANPPAADPPAADPSAGNEPANQPANDPPAADPPAADPPGPPGTQEDRGVRAHGPGHGQGQGHAHAYGQAKDRHQDKPDKDKHKPKGPPEPNGSKHDR